MNHCNSAVSEPSAFKMTLLSLPSEDSQALVCTIESPSNKTLDSFKWKNEARDVTDFIQSKLQKVGQYHSAVSVLKVMNTDWDKNYVYTCEATYAGVKHTRKMSKGSVVFK